MIRSFAPAPDVTPCPYDRPFDRPYDRPTRGVLGLLSAGVPLTLLCDLIPALGPDSALIYREEYDAEAPLFG